MAKQSHQALVEILYTKGSLGQSGLSKMESSSKYKNSTWEKETERRWAHS